MKLVKQLATQFVIMIILCSCAVGPNYKRPDVSDLTPADWHWKVAEPKDTISKGEWWKVFDDPVLNELETEVVAKNQNLWAAVARVDQARAAARITRSQFFPELSLDPLYKRERTSGHLPTPIPFNIPSAYVDTYSIPFDLSYEIDVWGRVRRSFESSRAQAQASVSDEQNVLLTLTADLAANYFLFRSLEAEIAILERTVALRSDSLRILKGRFEAGVIPELDVAQASTELATSKADLADVTRQRAETLHAIALLCGRAPSSFDVPQRPLVTSQLVVPAGLPSSLLERRPDISHAERLLAARNAEIGVAIAAYFPALHLTGQAGYLSADAKHLFSKDSFVWSISPGINWSIFNAGKTAAQVKQARASYEEALADYRQTVLTAFKEVEDSLAQIVFRIEQSAAQTEAVASAKQASELAKARYEVGITNYLQVLDAKRSRLQQERQKAQIEGQRFAAIVRLIKALGGGWEGAENPTQK